MRRTQIQLPDRLYDEVKRVAEAQEWSVAEVLRRGAEYIVRCYPQDERGAPWALPLLTEAGELLGEPEEWRGALEDDLLDRTGSRSATTASSS